MGWVIFIHPIFIFGDFMFKQLSISFSLVIISILLLGCTAAQRPNEQEQEQVYIFDTIPEEKTIEPTKTGEFPDIAQTYFVVQVGAYTTKDKADSFTEMSKKKSNYKFNVVYSDNLKLYLVQVIPFFKQRSEAEIVRNNLWKMSEFVDAWILTINK